MNNRSNKNPSVILSVLIIYIILVYIVINYWNYSKSTDNNLIAILSLISAIIWWAILLWAMHHTAYQFISIFSSSNISNSNKKNKKEKNPNQISIAIVYPTCNDLDEKALLSCVGQNYNNFHVYICDDSTNQTYMDKIDIFLKKYNAKCDLIRRAEKKGFKAGNLNNAIKDHIKEDWICLTDSDQIFKSDFLSEICKEIPNNFSDISYIQARNEALNNNDLSKFQKVMKEEITLYYTRDLYVRNKYGFVPLLGHGALLNRSNFIKMNGFPELVSEDFAFALNAAAKGYRNHYAMDVKSYEAYPYDFGAFVTRLCKFSGASAELIRKIVPQFIFNKSVSWIEKWDFGVMLFWYFLMPIIVINGFVSAYVTNYFWINRVPYIHPILPYLFTYMLLTLLLIIISTQENKIWVSLKFYFWTSAIYSATLPLTGFYFLKGFFIKPKFTITPKEKNINKLNKTSIILVVILGLSGIGFSLYYWSPFSWFLLGHSLSYCLYPLFINLNIDNFIGKLSRILIYIPGTLMIIALIALWQYII